MWLIIWVVVFEVMSGAIGYFASPRRDPSWYRSLNKSPLNPPGYVFGIVWPILYLTLAIFGWSLSSMPQFSDVYQYFWIQMVLNWIWSPVFFGFHNIRLAFIIQFLLVVLNALIIYTLWLDGATKLALLICPYFVWLSFALYLIAYINVNN